MSGEHDPTEIDTGDGAEAGEIDEFGYDEDVVINDYEGQDAEIAADDQENDGIDDENEDDAILDGVVEVEFTKSMSLTSHPKYKKTSGIKKMSSYEYAALFGKVALYIQQGKISVTDNLLDTPEVLSGDEFRISRKWIEERRKSKIPLKLERMLFPGNIEKLDPANLKTDDDYEFKDDNSDSHLFYQNFRKNPYGE